MDRNLTEQLKKLSSELVDAQQQLLDPNLSHAESDALEEVIADLEDEIWDLEETIREEAEYEYGIRTAKGWN